LFEWAGLLEPGELVEETSGELGETAEQLRCISLDLVVRQRPLERRSTSPRHRIAENETREAELPGVAMLLRLPVALAVLGVDAPAHTALHHPLRNRLHVAGAHGELAPHRGEGEEIEHLRSTLAPRDQRQHALQRLEDRAVATHLSICDVVGDEASVRRVSVEDRLDERRVRFDVRHHDHHVARLDTRLLEQREQLVVQHLDLPHGTVAGVEGDGSIVRIERPLVRSPVAWTAQMEQIGLHTSEERPQRGLLVELQRGFTLAHPQIFAFGDQDLLEFGAQQAERDEQRITFAEVRAGLDRFGGRGTQRQIGPVLP
jgi:hypothetical protein